MKKLKKRLYEHWKKKLFLILFIFVLLLYPPVVFAKVTAEEVSGKAIGDCRKALYVTGAIAQSDNPRTPAGRLRENIANLLSSTELNAVVIDILVDQPLFNAKMKRFVESLKEKNIYCIGRIVVAQNNHFAQLYPESVLTRKSNGQPWSCMGSKGIDPASPALWQYVINNSKKAIDFGFDEVQYDYIRFPSDCGPKDIDYPIWDEKKSRREIMADFFKTLTLEVRAYNPRTVLAIDVFGKAVLKEYGERAKEETGQFYEDMVDHFDIISPMNYPSHYSPNSWGIPVPANEPYKIVFKGLQFITNYLKNKTVRAKLRPWLQYFSIRNYQTKIHVDYNESMILQQRGALADLGINSFYYWDPYNRYNRGGILKK